ncbi:site-specific integrase [Mesorhizobium sp. KR9-304]|uniref:site-specific integrase n=1 Tax=Mesorhizobium sp. KR9-304 TaxID=3156614 RepID=UPI0032B4AC01
MKIDPEIAGRSIAYAELVQMIESSRHSDTRKRDMVSAVNRVLKMGGFWGNGFVFSVDAVRSLTASIRPAAHGVSPKSLANIQSNLRAALRLVGIIDAAGGYRTKRDPHWSLLHTVFQDKSLLGLSRFINYCAEQSVHPETVNDDIVLGFHAWLKTRTIEPRPDTVARAIPRLWNRASERVAGWPTTRLRSLQIGIKPRKTAWADLPDALRREAEAYLAMRANPDIFDERLGAPVRPLAQGTLRLQREHIRLAFDVVSKAATPVETLADLVASENFKAVLRHYLGETTTKPNAFATAIAKTLIAVATHHVRVEAGELARLNKLAAKLPAVPFDLTAKNKALIQAVRDENVLGALVGLPSRLFVEARRRLAHGRSAHAVAHSGLAIALLLIAPMRPQNLVALNWRRHVREFHGPRGVLTLLIPATETKTRRADLLYELDETTSAMLRWNRKVLPSIGADPEGDVFAKPGGKRLGQSSLSRAITVAIEKRVGIEMTAHQFRHLAAYRYLEARPEDFETVRQLLGHSFGKTTLIYAGLSGERASRAYGEIVVAKMAALEKRRSRKIRRKRFGNAQEI